MEKNKVVITHLPSTKDKAEVFAIAKRSRILINAICQYSKELKKNGFEVYERHVNILHTEKGYYCAFFESDLDKNRTQPKEEIIKPFKGFDGRMKIKLLDKDNEEVIEDLATVVAKTFVPNPDNLPYVKFKDKNPENCKAENLYWSDIK